MGLSTWETEEIGFPRDDIKKKGLSVPFESGFIDMGNRGNWISKGRQPLNNTALERLISESILPVPTQPAEPISWTEITQDVAFGILVYWT